MQDNLNFALYSTIQIQVFTQKIVDLRMTSASSGPRTVEEIFKNYSARRTGIIRALTSDVDEFYGLCDPDKENLCLYGHTNESWEVKLPAGEVPPELPQPAVGINFARDGMDIRNWLSLIAVHSDCWLLSVSSYLGARLNRDERKRLFSLINDLPTVFEVVSEWKPVRRVVALRSASYYRKRDYEEEDEHSETRCGSCNGSYNSDEFWIECECDTCERWFHGRCVMITPAMVENVKHYKCPTCVKEGRH